MAEPTSLFLHAPKWQDVPAGAITECASCAQKHAARGQTQALRKRGEVAYCLASTSPKIKSKESHRAMAYVLDKPIVVIGMMGAGKTAVGTLLARRLNLPFYDSDHELEDAAGITIKEIFERFGEADFRQKEIQVIKRLMKSAPCVLAMGGGAYLQEETYDLVSREGLSVYLEAELDLLWARVKSKKTRPLLNTPDPKGTLAALLEERKDIYALADITVPTEASISVGTMCERVEDAILKYQDSRPSHEH